MKNSLRIDIGLLVLRVSASLMMLTHGIPKLQKLIAGGNIEFGDPLHIGSVPSLFLAVIGEVVCPLLVIFGYKTRYAALPVVVTMAVAAFKVHASDPFDVKEMALLFLLCFVVIVLLGPGKFSIDKK